MDKILIAEDEKVTRLTLTRLLEKEGLRVVEALDGSQAVDLFRRERPAVVILDLMMPVMSGMEVIRVLKEIDASVPVIIATASGDISTAVETMKLGAYDFLVKPVNPGKLAMTVRRALEKRKLEQELTRLHTSENASLERFAGKTPAMKRIAEQLKQVAATDFSVIIQGETGTGKTLLAKILHNMSGRADKAFVKIDLGSMSETIIESELFGYEKGAFTGAVQTQKGFFETADGGTAFLDDLENVTPAVQSKLLSVVESREVCRLGGRKTINLDIRIIAAANTDIQKSVREGKFREDLFFRLGEFIITLPPLRERTDDIPFFINKFRDEAASELKSPVRSMTSEAMDRLMRYPWPGNFREMKNVVRRVVLLAGGTETSLDHVDFVLGSREGSLEAGPVLPLRDAVGDVEKKYIKRALETTKGNKARAAEILQIDVKTLRTKMSEHGID
jgi:DNA-binding NtrC family response regulator